MNHKGIFDMRNLLTVDPRIRINKIRDFIDEPITIYVNEFDEEAVLDFEEDMDKAHNTNQPIIPIVIDSFGGSVYGAISMVSSVLNAKVPVATIVKGKAMSAGAILFGFGTEGYRFMDPNAVLMIHDAASISHGKVEEIKADAAHLEHLNQSWYKRLANHIGQPDNYILDLIAKNRHADWFLTAKEGKKHKLVNHLRVPELHTKITLDINFA